MKSLADRLRVKDCAKVTTRKEGAVHHNNRRKWMSSTNTNNANYDANLLYQFLTQTPEGALRKMLIDPKFTADHFGILLKVIRCGSEDQFCTHFVNADFPRAKFNAKEIALKETFWPTCVATLNQHGLLSPAQKAAA
jgi:hypothetical protein